MSHYTDYRERERDGVTSPVPSISTFNVNRGRTIRCQVSIDAVQPQSSSPNYATSRTSSAYSERDRSESPTISHHSETSSSTRRSKWSMPTPIPAPVSPTLVHVFDRRGGGRTPIGTRVSMDEEEPGEGEDDGEAYAEGHRAPIDAGLRSQPGVIGLGEGWAGGPQRREKKTNNRRWFKRRKVRDVEHVRSDDPLALWDIEEDQEVRSPLKNIWNRSKSFFASSSALPEVRKGNGNGNGNGNVGKGKGLFSRSRLNLFPPGAAEGREKVKRSNPLTALFSRSTSRLPAASKSTGQLLSTPASSSFPQQNTRAVPSYASGNWARSESQLVPSNRSSLPSPSTSSPVGLLPAWRSQSKFANPGSTVLTPTIPEADEHQDSVSSTSLVTPITPSSFVLRREETGFPRTSTFGAGDRASQMEVQVIERTAGLDSIAAWANDAGVGTPMSMSPIRGNTPELSEGSDLRKQSMLRRLRAMSPFSSPSIPTSSTSDIQPPPNKRIFGDGQTRPNLATSLLAPVMDRPAQPADIRNARPRMDKSKRASWMDSLPSDNWLKRLSKLTEADEVEETPHRETGFIDNFVSVRNSSLHSLDMLLQQNNTNRVNENWARVSRHPASQSMPALNLDLRNNRVSLDLDDILDPVRRASIIDQLDPDQSRRQALASMHAHNRNHSMPVYSSSQLEQHFSDMDISNSETGYEPATPRRSDETYHQPITPVPVLENGSVKSFYTAREGEGSGSASAPSTPSIPQGPQAAKVIDLGSPILTSTRTWQIPGAQSQNRSPSPASINSPGEEYEEMLAPPLSFRQRTRSSFGSGTGTGTGSDSSHTLEYEPGESTVLFVVQMELGKGGLDYE